MAPRIEAKGAHFGPNETPILGPKCGKPAFYKVVQNGNNKKILAYLCKQHKPVVRRKTKENRILKVTPNLKPNEKLTPGGIIVPR
jgi:hypothetical protein